MSKKSDFRLKVIYFSFAFIFLVISFKIISLQVFKRDFFKNLARRQHYRLLELNGRRGTIFDRQMRVLASGLNCYSIFADPAQVNDKAETAKSLALRLKLSRKKLAAKLNKNNRFVWVKRKVSWQEKEKIKALDLSGVHFVREEKRFYPQGDLSSSVIGIVDIDNKGLEGLEIYYNSYLSGKDGWVRVPQDSSSREIILSSQVITPQAGADIMLTLDAQIQYWAETYLAQTAKEFKAKKGAVVVLDASNGEILALTNYPSFNPNDFKRPLPEDMRNGAVCDIFEPGSVFKAITLLAAIDKNTFSDTDTIFCENGKLKIPGSVLHDWKSYGELTFREVFMKSSNIGVAKIVQVLGSENLQSYIKKLGFGEVSGIDFPGEAKGLVKPVKKWSRTSPYTIPIGQEIGVNLLQLARAFAVIANDGYLIRPHLLKRICSQGFCKDTLLEKKRVLSSATTQRAKSILIDVVSKGTGKRAAIEGRAIGGKTGTAQKYDPKIKKYSPYKYRATFVGFVADSQRPLVIAVSLDEPRKSHFGGVVAAPLFKKIAQEVIKYNEGEKTPVQ